MHCNTSETIITTAANSSTVTPQAYVSNSIFTTLIDRNASISNDSKENNRANISETDTHKLSKTCPGALEYLGSLVEAAIYHVNVSNCLQPHPHCRHGVVYGTCEKVPFCQYRVHVPRGMVVRAHFHKLSQVYTPGRTSIYGWSSNFLNGFHTKNKMIIRNYTQYETESITSSSNEMYVAHINSPTLRVRFLAVKHRFHIVYNSHHGGYLTALFRKTYYLTHGFACSTLRVPDGQVVMVTFDRLQAANVWQSVHVTLQGNVAYDLRDFQYEGINREAATFDTEELQVRVRLPHFFFEAHIKMLFSFYAKGNVPKRLKSGLYNCSGNDYRRFQQHLDCNLKVECEDGRDEAGHCPFSSPACQGLEVAGDRCFKLFRFRSSIGPFRAITKCQSLGLGLASFKTDQDVADIHTLLYGRHTLQTMTGLMSGMNGVPFMYRHYFRWFDNTVVYSMKHINIHYRPSRNDVFYEYRKFDPSKPISLSTGVKFINILCDKRVPTKPLSHTAVVYIPASRQLSNFSRKLQIAFVCTNDQVTHSFLSCDPKSGCGQSVCTFTNMSTHSSPVLSTTTEVPVHAVAMYKCTSDDLIISYTLVCDFRNDCVDKSDESFCQHPLCEEFSCCNGQCVAKGKHCNNISDCFDDSDEDDCPLAEVNRTITENQQLLIDLDGKGYFIYRIMNDSEPCPDTHYRCSTAMVHCLPIYTRCNELYDCPYHEDERDCEDITCPGLYRCRDSTVCVHVDHVCDGWSQCPQRDDEWLCGMVCPPQCLCQGHAFLCSQPFSAHFFHQLRCLDARGSGITVDKLTNNTYLVHLNLADCCLRLLPEMMFPNLQVFDLSKNQLTSIVMNAFLTLQNLQVLVLKANPLTSVTSTVSDQRQYALRTLDLSQTYLSVFSSQILSLTPRVQNLNLSFSSIHTVTPLTLQGIRGARKLDLRGNSMTTFPLDIFLGLNDLELVLSPHYKLCCKDLLPNKIPQTRCVSPKHLFSSCKSMLASDLHRLTFLFFSILAVLGNLVCVISQCVRSRKRCVFLINLQCANFCMGVYSCVIAAAHEMSNGHYFRYEVRWTASVACTMAGFLSLLSSEVSVLTIFLLTLDSLSVLCFPPSAYRFSRRSAAVACGVMWSVGVFLASLPLLPGLQHWGRYGQTAVCSLMTYDMNRFRTEFGLFQGIVVCHWLICLVVCAGQVLLYRATPKHFILIDSDKKQIYEGVVLKMKIAITDAVVWFSVTIASVLTWTGGVESEKVTVFMAVMVLPLNSAVNPLLCLWHTVANWRQQEQEDRLLRVFKSKMNQQFIH